MVQGIEPTLLTPQAFASTMADVDVGDRAPDFALPNQHGETVQLADLLDRPTVLFFYPGDFTFVCTREACDFRDNLGAFEAHGVNVVGVSTDPPDEHDRFREEYELGFDLLADEDGEVREAYDADGLLGTQRVTFVIDSEGTIRKRFRSPFHWSHVDEALEGVEETLTDSRPSGGS
jgi:peroxiredoxin Q/BCP